MIALRLAEHVAHTVDVDGMLDGMTPEQFDEWCLKDRIEPIGYTTHMTALIAWLLHTYLAGGEGEPLQKFLPWLEYAPAQKPQNRQAIRILDAIAGRR